MRLRQVLMNLTGNAIKFTEKGEVRVRVSADQTSSSSRIRFDIIDTGIGMTAEQTANLFQPFVQADESMSRKYGGTGLGLAISKRLAKFMRGELTFQSEPGKGSTFSVWVDGGPLAGIPMREGLTESMLALGTQHTDSAQLTLAGRILLVEDGIDNQHLLTMHLTLAGAEVVLAENGKVALQRLAESHFNVVLMDMQMPVMDGYTATSEARRLGYTVPIIALTAHAMSGDRTRCIQAGCTDYLTKPIDQELLLRTVASYLMKQHGEADQTMMKQHEAQQAAARPAALPAVSVAASTGRAVPIQARDKEAQAAAMRQAVLGFVRRLPAKVDALVSLLAAGDLDELRRVTHQLKGAGTGFGFPAITEFAARAEAAIKAGAIIDTAKRQIDELVELIRNTPGYDRAGETAVTPAAAVPTQEKE
jgi:CheY-like chemotaxis protein/anti-sigma regulatory factor (Ser/Thr protein kinase)